MSQGPRIALSLWLLGVVACAWLIAKTPFTTDMSAFLPSSPEPTQRVLVQQLRDGVASRLILIGLEGGTPELRAELSRRMAAALRAYAGFALVENGDGVVDGKDRDYVWRNRYLLSPGITPERFTAAGLRTALEDDLQWLASGMSPLLKDSLPHDPTGEAVKLAQILTSGTQRTVRDEVWVSGDARQTLLLVQTRAPGFDIDAQEAALNVVNAGFAKACKAVDGANDVKMVATGPGIFGVHTRARMKHDVTLYSALASGAIVLLLLAVFRSPVVLALTLVAVVSGALAGFAAVSLCFGYVHGITVGFGVTLIGEAVDYAIYLFARTDQRGGAAHTLSRLWPTLRLGVAVSICGFAAMLFSSFTGFVQLGLFTIAGLAVAVGVTRCVLPALLPASFAGTRRVVFARPLLEWMNRAHQLRLPLVLLVCAALVLVAARGTSLWQDDIASMSPIPAADQRLDRELRQATGAPDVRHIVIATALTLEQVLLASEDTASRLEALLADQALGGYDSPNRYLPSLRTQATRRAALPAPATLVANLAEASAGLPFQPALFEPFLADVAAARQSLPLTRAALDGPALSLKVDALLLRDGKDWAAVMPLRDVVDAGRIEAAVAQDRDGAKVVLLDLKTASDRLLLQYRREALVLASCGSLVIGVLLLLHFRSLRITLSILAPLAAAVALTLALLTLGGRQLSIFNLFGLLLVVAVGSNYCLFFQRGGFKGDDGERTALSLVLANACTVLGFGVLSLSAIPVLTGIGGTVAIGTALSLVCAAILAPAVEPVQAWG